jgi:hypothetical protein
MKRFSAAIILILFASVIGVFAQQATTATAEEKRQAIDYAETRACFRKGEIRVSDSTGKLERTIAFNDANRQL